MQIQQRGFGATKAKKSFAVEVVCLHIMHAYCSLGVPAGKRNFMKAAAKKYAKEIKVQEASVQSPRADDERFQLALMKALNPKPKIPKVDLEFEMNRLGLSGLFPVDVWPSIEAVRELKSQLDKDSSFICSDLRK